MRERPNNLSNMEILWKAAQVAEDITVQRVPAADKGKVDYIESDKHITVVCKLNEWIIHEHLLLLLAFD